MKRHILLISLFTGALIQPRKRVVDLLSVIEGVLLSDNNFVSTSIAKDVVNVLRVRVSRQILCASASRSRSTIVLQFNGASLVEEMGVDVIVLVTWSKLLPTTNLRSGIGSSLSACLCSEHLTVEKGQIRRLATHILHVLNHAHRIVTCLHLIAKRFTTIIGAVDLHVGLRLVLVPLR